MPKNYNSDDESFFKEDQEMVDEDDYYNDNELDESNLSGSSYD